MKMQNNLISMTTMTMTVNDNKKFWEKCNVTETKFDVLNNENENVQRKVMIKKKFGKNFEDSFDQS